MQRNSMLGLAVLASLAVLGWGLQTVIADDKVVAFPAVEKTTRTAVKVPQITELSFDDAASARVQGRLVGKDKHEYTFNARKGQKVVLAVSSDLAPWIGIDLLAPTFASTVQNAPAIYSNFIDGTTRWEGVAPGSGTYTVRLGLLRSQAQKMGRVDYELDVNIK